MDFLNLVKVERQNQINKHGYAPEHDDDHVDGELADAAACYANTINSNEELIPYWPWEPEYFKKEEHDRKQQLIIAAAFINAEYDRIVRAEKSDTRCRECNYLFSKDGNTWCALDGMPMDEDDTRCEQYCLPPFEASEDNPLLQSFMRSSRE